MPRAPYSTRSEHHSPGPPEPLAISLTPAGHLLLREGLPDDAPPSAELARRLWTAFERGTGAGLLQLGAGEVATALPPAFAFWRDFAHAFVARACALSAEDASARRVEVPPPAAAALQSIVDCSPPMIGAENLSPDALADLWRAMSEALASEVSDGDTSIAEYFARRNPAWKSVGRVHLHLAENRRDPERPFAFIATYATGVSANGKAQFRPLGKALQESSSAQDRQRLLALLSPLQRAAERSAFVRELIERKEIFHPLGWTAVDAHRFLKEVPLLEDSGVVVRIPDWWKPRSPPRPVVSVTVGGKEPSKLGLDALVDFSVNLTIDGEPLTADELRALRRSESGLALLKGRWVEVDREKLDQVLDHWRMLEQTSAAGLPLSEAMRLLAGLPRQPTDSAEAGASVIEWSGVHPGPWLESVLRELREGSDETAVLAPIADELHATLRPYQRRGVAWLWLLTRLRLGACLADDMGLGKTLQVLALFLLHRTGGSGALAGPHLLVVPASLLGNWRAEAERFAPSLRLLVAHPSAMERAQLAALDANALRRADVVVTTYGQLQRSKLLSEMEFGLCVLDEAQAIKNPSIQQTRAAKAVRSKARVALTGTPVENRAMDLWSLFDFLNPGLLGSAQAMAQFIKRSGPQGYAPLRQLIRPYLLRRLKTDRAIVPDLPEKTEVYAYCGLSRRQAALYEESVASLKNSLVKLAPMERRGLVLAYLLRFKQICNHPSHWLGDGAWAPEDSGKFARLREIVETIASRQEKALFFTQFQEAAQPLANFLGAQFGRPGLVLTGKTRVQERQELVRAFQEDDRVPFFVLSVKAGGTGLNLTAASHVVHFDRWWNPAVENQATDRAFRIGQKRNVLVHKLLCRGTLEERIDALIAQKQSLTRDLVGEGGEIALTEIDDAELLKLVQLDVTSALQDA